MKLYEISDVFSSLFNEFEAINNYEPDKNEDGNYIDDDGNVINIIKVKEDMCQAWFDTLDGVEQEFDIKAENIAVYIKELMSDVQQLKAEEQTLKIRRKAKEQQANRLSSYLLNNMQKIERKKIDKPKAVISVRNNPESVEIKSTNEFVQWAMKNNEGMLKYAEPEIRKTVVKNALKNGANIPFAELVKTQRLDIK